MLALLVQVGRELGPALGRDLLGQVGGVPATPGEHGRIHPARRAVSHASGCLELGHVVGTERDGAHAKAVRGLGATTARCSVSAR